MKMAASGADWSKRLIKTREGGEEEEGGLGEQGRGMGEGRKEERKREGEREEEKPASTALII